MTIKFHCPHCKTGLVVKANLAGRRGQCPKCKQPVTIPASGAPPADVEGSAAAALRERPAPAAKAPPEKADRPVKAPASGQGESKAPESAPPPAAPSRIDFRCPQCDEPVQAEVALAGKQMPCPHCTRIIRVPLLEKRPPTDWRALAAQAAAAQAAAASAAAGAAAAPTAPRPAAAAEPEEDDAEIEELEVWLRRRRRRFVAAGVAAAALLAWLGWLGWDWWTLRRQEWALTEALAIAEKFANPGDQGVALPVGAPVREALAGVYKAAGECYLGQERAPEAKQRLSQARAQFASETQDPSGAGEAFLIQLALSQVELGGDEADVRKERRIPWSAVRDELRQTLQLIRTPEARQTAIREISRRLIEKGHAELAIALARRPGSTAEAPDALAIVGLELLRAGRRDQAEAVAAEAKKLFLSPLLVTMESEPAEPAAPPEGEAPEAVPQPASPVIGFQRAPLPASLVALLAVLNQADQQIAPNGNPQDQLAWTIGTVEGLARQGKWDEARKLAQSVSTSVPDQIRLFLAIATVALDQNPGDARDLREALRLAEGVRAWPARASWSLLQLVQLSARAGLTNEVENVVRSIPDASLRGWAQLELLRLRLAGTHGTAPETWAEAVDPQSPAHALAFEALARHNAAYGSRSALKAALGWQPDEIKALGLAGVAQGMRSAN
ncbi:MAG: hypothetical protein NZ700_17315 [Gemmataceae bacterium]|nr:hypothetical protein [Gemmataceae bacterium]MDW8263833.1 hypothetical protein [Gemmataceae bacterium]